MPAWSQKWIPFGYRRCPGEQTLAAYADQQLLASECQVIEKHLSTCDRCLQQVGFLASAGVASQEVPAALLQTALDRTSRRPASAANFLKPWIPAFSAALILLAIFLSWELRSNRTQSIVPPSQIVARQTPVPPYMQTAPAPQTLVRGAPEDTSSPLLSPLPKQYVAAADLEFRWQSQPRVSFYELRLVSDSGGVVWEGRADATVKSIRLPARIRLQTGSTYYACLRVHLDSGAVRLFDPVQFVAGE
jgi:hypothetical protein